MDGEEEEVEQPPPTVFVHRVDTYLGRILAQHLGTSSPSNLDATEKPLDLSFLAALPARNCFKVIGSYWYPARPADAYDLPRHLPKVPIAEKLFRSDNNEDLLKAFDAADVYVFHVLDEDGENNLLAQTEQAIALAHARAVEAKSRKTMILVSSLMTWGKPKAKKKLKKVTEDEPEEEEEDKSHVEATYRKRHPHPDFKVYHTMEKDFATFGRNNRRVKATVVGAGIVYGYGENQLHWLFKAAWENAPSLPMLGDGKCHIPMIHARDLAQVVRNICETKPESRYVVAVDNGSHTLLQVTSAISKNLSTGAVLKCPADDLLRNGMVSQKMINMFSTDLRFEAGIVKEAMQIRWVSEEGFKQFIKKDIKDFRTMRKLLPIKAAVFGPPFSGKTTLAKRIGQFYKIPSLTPTEVAEETEKRLKTKISTAPTDQEISAEDADKEEHEEDDKEEERPSVTEAKQRLADIAQDRSQNNGDLSAGMLLRLVREKLLSKPCQNQGYILDGYPVTYSDAKELFGPEEGEAEEEEEPEAQEESAEKEEEETEAPAVDKRAVPEYVFYLDASMDVVQRRKISEPDHPWSTASREEVFKQRFEEYNRTATDEESILTYFDDIGNHAMWLDVSRDDTKTMEHSFSTAVSRIGKPHNYGPTKEEAEAERIEKEALRSKKVTEEAEANRAKEEESRSDRWVQEEKWEKHLDTLRLEDYGRRQLSGMPMHHYLTRYVLPTIHQGLLECARIMPEDPVDFVAEYLLGKAKPRPDNFLTDRNQFLVDDAVAEQQNASGDFEKPEPTDNRNVDVTAPSEEFLVTSRTHRVLNLDEPETAEEIEYFITNLAHQELKALEEEQEGQEKTRTSTTSSAPSEAVRTSTSAPSERHHSKTSSLSGPAANQSNSRREVPNKTADSA